MTRIDSLRLLLDSAVDVLLTGAFCFALVLLAIYGWTA